MNRRPAVAGAFYPSSERKLRDEIQKHLVPDATRVPAYGAVIPHAGYMYSGDVAGAVFSRLAIPSSVVILNPNHTGMGAPLSIWAKGSWTTPLGEVPVDETLATDLINAHEWLVPDFSAHLEEHAGEVMLPFLQVLRPDVRVVLVTVAPIRLEPLIEFGQALARVILKQTERPLIIASSDMTHFESDESARQRDQLAIQPMLKLDELELFRVVEQQRITMCGVAPTAVMITAVKELGATKAELVKYDTSATAGGDTRRVVGYAGMIFS